MREQPLDYATPPPIERRKFRVTSWMVLIPLVALGLPTLVILVILPSMGRAREPAKRVMCGNNLRQLGFALRNFAQDNGGILPGTLQPIIDGPDGGWPGQYTCPSTTTTAPEIGPNQSLFALLQKSNAIEYIYVADGLNISSLTSATVVAYEPLSNHKGKGMNVLYGDWNVQFVSNETANGKQFIADVIRQADQGIKPIIPSTQPQ